MLDRFRSVAIEIGHEREKDALRIVADGAISNPCIADGRLIPLVILDTSERTDLSEYIRLHEYIESGDVNCRWGKIPDHNDTVALILSFLRPTKLVAIVEFELTRNHGVLVEQILAAKALYIQSGREGDRLKDDVDRPKVIVEVPVIDFQKFWDKIHYRHVFKTMRDRGFSRSSARQEALKFLKEIQQLRLVRVPRQQK